MKTLRILLFQIFCVEIIFVNNIYAQLPTINDPKLIIIQELESIHGLSTERIKNSYRDDLKKILSDFRDIYINADVYYPHLNANSLPFVKNTIASNYCTFIDGSIDQENKAFLDEIYEEAKESKNENLRISLYSCYQNLGSQEGVRKLLHYYNQENEIYMKQHILDLAINVFNEPVDAPKVGDQVHNLNVKFNLTEPFYERNSDSWKDLIENLFQKTSSLEKTIKSLYPDSKEVNDSFAFFNRDLTKALEYENNKKNTSSIKSSNDDQDPNFNKQVLQNNDKQKSIDKNNRKPQSIDESQEQTENNKQSYLKIFLIIGFITLVLMLFKYLKRS